MPQPKRKQPKRLQENVYWDEPETQRRPIIKSSARIRREHKRAKSKKARARKVPIAKPDRDWSTIVTDVISARGRQTFAEGPKAGQPQTAQTMLLSSTAIAWYKYDEEREILRIGFVNGGVYDYFNVPIIVVLALGRAGSKGKYFFYNIRTKYGEPLKIR